MEYPSSRPISRRRFVQTTAAATTAAVVMPHALAARPRGERLRAGLVGCGGRGTGAVRDYCVANEDVEVVALGDLFPDRLQQCRATLTELAAENPDFARKYRVTDERCFTGLDAYRRVLDSDIDIVLLATPPFFRPAHIEAAVAAGKHIFTEKPVAVDPAGVRSCLASYEAARSNGLAVVAGTQRRHDPSYRAIMERVHEGAIGEIVGGQVYWNQGGLWHHAPRPEWSDTEWQLRNWLYFTWLSGDHIVEQHVHNIDVANWALGAHPVKAVAVGGRQVRTDPVHGHIYDHFAVDFEYPGGIRILSMCRQIDGTANFVGERFFGTKGRTDAGSTIEGTDGVKFTPFEGERHNPFVLEHANLVDSIRSGRPLNELKQVAESTLAAIMGREAAYTGQELTWDEVLEADQDLTPPQLGFGPLGVPPVAVPGQTPLQRRWIDGRV
jgi:myo-inositol 2-dehydrogenase / D-chiro-inositol 1-dehydrogenase